MIVSSCACIHSQMSKSWCLRLEESKCDRIANVQLVENGSTSKDSHAHTRTHREHPGGQEHPHPLIISLILSKNSAPIDLPLPVLITLFLPFTLLFIPHPATPELEFLPIDLMQIHTLITKRTKRLLPLALLKVLARRLGRPLFEPLQCQLPCSTVNGSGVTKRKPRRSAAGGAILGFGLAVLSTPTIETGRAEVVVAVGKLGVDRGSSMQMLQGKVWVGTLAGTPLRVGRATLRRWEWRWNVLPCVFVRARSLCSWVKGAGFADRFDRVGGRGSNSVACADSWEPLGCGSLTEVSDGLRRAGRLVLS